MRAPAYRISKYFPGARGAPTGQSSLERRVSKEWPPWSPSGSPPALPCPAGLSPPACTAPSVAFLAPAEAADGCAAAAGEQAQPKFRLLKSGVNSPLDFCMEIQRVSAGQRSRRWLILCSHSLAGIQLCGEPAKTFHGIPQRRGNTAGVLFPSASSHCLY